MKKSNDKTVKMSLDLESVWGIARPSYDAKTAYDISQLFTFELSGEEQARERCHSLSLHLENGTPLSSSIRTWAVSALSEIANGADATKSLGLKRSRGRADATSSKQNQDRMIAFLVQQVIDQQSENMLMEPENQSEAFKAISDWLQVNDIPSYEEITRSGASNKVSRKIKIDSVKKIYLQNKAAILAAKIV